MGNKDSVPKQRGLGWARHDSDHPDIAEDVPFPGLGKDRTDKIAGESDERIGTDDTEEEENGK